MSASTPVAMTVTLHTETISRVTLTDLSRAHDTLVSLKFGDDISAVSLLGQHGEVRELIVRALLEIIRLHDDDHQSDELRALGSLIFTREE
jgi:hypothetical protein